MRSAGRDKSGRVPDGRQRRRDSDDEERRERRERRRLRAADDRKHDREDERERHFQRARLADLRHAGEDGWEDED